MRSPPLTLLSNRQEQGGPGTESQTCIPHLEPVGNCYRLWSLHWYPRRMVPLPLFSTPLAPPGAPDPGRGSWKQVFADGHIDLTALGPWSSTCGSAGAGDGGPALSALTSPAGHAGTGSRSRTLCWAAALLKLPPNPLCCPEVVPLSSAHRATVWAWGGISSPRAFLPQGSLLQTLTLPLSGSGCSRGA